MMDVDEALFPLVFVRPGPTPAASDLPPFFDAIDELFARDEQFAMVVDPAGVTSMPSATWRRRLSDWMNQPEILEKSGRYNVGSSVIVRSTTVRGAMTALQWLWAPANPLWLAPDHNAAVDWAVDRLRQSEVPISIALSHYLAQGSRARP